MFKNFHGSIVGRGGSTLRKIREDTDTKIELPSEASDSDVIAIIGRKENVLKARARILAIEKEMVQFCVSVCLEISTIDREIFAIEIYSSVRRAVKI